MPNLLSVVGVQHVGLPHGFIHALCSRPDCAMWCYPSLCRISARETRFCPCMFSSMHTQYGIARLICRKRAWHKPYCAFQYARFQHARNVLRRAICQTTVGATRYCWHNMLENSVRVKYDIVYTVCLRALCAIGYCSRLQYARQNRVQYGILGAVCHDKALTSCKFVLQTYCLAQCMNVCTLNKCWILPPILIGLS